MTHGFDTGFLVAAEVTGHVEHQAARARLAALRATGDRFAMAPQVLAEFVHVVSDPKRFSEPLEMLAAVDRARLWWHSPEVDRVLPGEEALRLFFDWMTTHQLGRKRILDTMLAATYRGAGIDSLLTTNARDFATFGGFTYVMPGASETTP
jgi:predicted nucleic acid-binding protein